MIDCYYKLTANRGIILWVFPWWCYTWLHVMIHYIIFNYNFKLSIKNDTVNHQLNKAKPFVIYQTKFGCFYFLTTWMCNMELADNSWSVISVTYSWFKLYFAASFFSAKITIEMRCVLIQKNYIYLFDQSLHCNALVRVHVFDCVLLCDALHTSNSGFKGLVCWVFKPLV